MKINEVDQTISELWPLAGSLALHGGLGAAGAYQYYKNQQAQADAAAAQAAAQQKPGTTSPTPLPPGVTPSTAGAGRGSPGGATAQQASKNWNDRMQAAQKMGWQDNKELPPDNWAPMGLPGGGGGHKWPPTSKLDPVAKAAPVSKAATAPVPATGTTKPVPTTSAPEPTIRSGENPNISADTRARALAQVKGTQDAPAAPGQTFSQNVAANKDALKPGGATSKPILGPDSLNIDLADPIPATQSKQQLDKAIGTSRSLASQPAGATPTTVDTTPAPTFNAPGAQHSDQQGYDFKNWTDADREQMRQDQLARIMKLAGQEPSSSSQAEPDGWNQAEPEDGADSTPSKLNLEPLSPLTSIEHPPTKDIGGVDLTKGNPDDNAQREELQRIKELSGLKI